MSKTRAAHFSNIFDMANIDHEVSSFKRMLHLFGKQKHAALRLVVKRPADTVDLSRPIRMLPAFSKSFEIILSEQIK